jgi:DNA topoisomerase-2
VAKRIVAIVAKKNKGGIQIKENQIKNHLCVFVNCLIENPAFDSQTKENLTTRKTAFGSTFDLSDKFLKQVEKSGVVEKILAFAQFKQRQALQKQGGTKKKRLIGISKLDDANYAGSAKSHDCTLILTEGDSAKSLAMSGLSVVGRDYYGVFPLKGKPLNVRDATHSQIMQNEELKNVTEILGLKYGMKYDETNVKTLRYGHIMIMADQDHDGSHIKGLIINFIHHFWPSLLDLPGFLEQFITPIVKATKGKKTLTFFTIPEYEAWKKTLIDSNHGWSIKYYKGLGTSTSSEAKEYFSNLELHEIPFSRLSDDHMVKGTERLVNDCDDTSLVQKMDIDINISSYSLINRSGSDLIQMAFAKSQAADRKVWINSIQNKDTFFDYISAQKNGGAKYSDFINQELVLFSQYDNLRSIPNIFDGFKPSQRKVMFACFLRNLKTEMKVVQLGGYVSEKSAYHHGEQSLQGTIVNLAQDFVGSNNINLLTPAGQFGTRRMGGDDAASARYIHTKLEKLARLIYHPDDDALLHYLDDDGLSIEPEYYIPVIPMCLVNGSEGQST